ncbi:nuclear receptor co-repressor 1 [Fistulifera solaris]|uniref:Nuclear receptor co-repressor 1 n=1 Tax=Fistulifera solaris TaxID=1519565 RepID=A0A1Z5JC82_FISSO|nr:nuclear receptor co-repressor 1 [Fistulifera solaris]|eukprot:GAX11585.1 nuclear receptor co-repressor 1 [Fistulifera solaris]
MSWQPNNNSNNNNSNDGFPGGPTRRFPDFSEEGEIGEEEGEIVVASNNPPPPPPPGNPNTPNSLHRSISNASASGAPVPPFARRGRRPSWGGNPGGGLVGSGRGIAGRGGIPPPFAGRGRAIGNRHGSFTGSVPSLTPPPPQQVRSQSFAGFQSNASAANPGMMHRRPTDPRFRSGELGGATAALARSGSFSLQDTNAPVLTSSYSSLAELANPHAEMLSRSTSASAVAETRPREPSFHDEVFSRSVAPPPADTYRALEGEAPDRYTSLSNSRHEGNAFTSRNAWSDAPPFREQEGPYREPPAFPRQQGGPSRDVHPFREQGVPPRDGPPFRETSLQESNVWRGNDGSGDAGFVPRQIRDGLPLSRSISEPVVPQHAESTTIGSNFPRPPPPPLPVQGGGYRGFRNDFRGEHQSDFPRRSPPHRGRPMFAGRGAGPPPPSISRNSSFGAPPQPLQSAHPFTGRRLDPRLQSETSNNVDAYYPPTSTVDEEGEVYGDVSSSTSPFRKSSFPSNSQLPSESFGRGDQPSQSSTAGSPQPRKPVVLTLFQPSPGSSLLPPAPSISETVEEAPLLTTTLENDEDADRAEKVVLFVSELLNNSNRKSIDPGTVSELPKKHLILRAVSLMDGKMKSKQSDVESKETELELQLKKNAELFEKARNEAAAEAERKNKEQLQFDKETDDKEIAELEAELETIMIARKEGFEQEVAAEEILPTASTMVDSIRAKREEEIKQQIKVASESFDKDIESTRCQLDQLQEELAKTKAQLAAAEVEHEEKSKVEDARSKPKDTQQSHHLVTNIIAENRRRAAEANISVFSAVVSEDENQVDKLAMYGALDEAKDPKFGKTSAEWATLTQQVSGLADALYHEPEETPFFARNQETHAAMEPLVKAFVRDTQTRLTKHWTTLAEEYEFRSRAYKRTRKENEKKGKQRNSMMARTSIIARTVMPILESTGSPGAAAGRTSTNPYRRARRGNEVRSEYEQEQIIAEIAAKEAMEKRIAFGGCKTPRQIGAVERQLTANFYNTFTAQKVDVVEQEKLCAMENMWTDTEKCIFLDRFLQHPKDFRKIASFLRNKTTRDCIKFYYDSKQTVSYKGALKEHIMRRKRRGEYHVWEATIQAALSVGAVVKAGTDEENPLVFTLPENDCTYNTRDLHPLNQEVFDSMEFNEEEAARYQAKLDKEAKSKKSKKRKVPDLFLLEPEQRKYLRPDTPEQTVEEKPLKKSLSKASVAESFPISMTDEQPSHARKSASKKWTASEKKIFLETVEKNGRNWKVLEDAIGSKSISQIKNYYYDWKKGGKEKPDKRGSKSDQTVDGKVDESQTEDGDIATPVPKRAVSAQTSSPLPDQPEHNEHLGIPMHLQQNSPFSQPSANLPFNAHSLSGLSPSFQMPGAPDILTQLRQMQLERSRSRSGTSSPELTADVWAQIQLLQSQQHQLSREDAFRALVQQQQHHQQQQQHLSGVLPFLQQQQLQQHPHGASINDWNNDQQLQRLILQNMRGLGLGGGGGNGALHQLALAGLSTGLPGVTHAPQDPQQVALQHLLALQQQNQARPEPSNTDALALLARALSEGRNNSHDPGNNNP